MSDHPAKPQYGPDDPIVEFILGITYEIWEQRGLDRIHDYYADDAPIYALSGVTRGAQEVVDGTRAMLESFPDRILVGDDVIWCSLPNERAYSSHRIVSTMTNRGATMFGAATQRQARVLTIADCELERGVIVREWLMRDMASMLRQLGLDLLDAARALKQSLTPRTRDWIAAEIERLQQGTSDSADADAQAILEALWISGDQNVVDKHYAPYAALHAAADELYSGRGALCTHYAALRDAFRIDALQVDHVAIPPDRPAGETMAVRWSATGEHVGAFLGQDATHRRVMILGATHWRQYRGRVIAEWTVFDRLGVLAQVV